ncbi:MULTISPECIES: heavy-metal-associated domain-containing protein [Anaerotruncus]|jgi:copper chaperone CopZ|uniref:heavy-metal-associated domain-containing protein n=1 Tax=Anaerotruncus TaxID=244127 RepID=UPI000836F8F1|nr:MULTISPECIES: heavy metal-associated domain-containing protein [Anaerotruncus]RGX54210.1 heavy-metal-associated domain-containing protein [Anaerotruncus sp. AF02-27]
MPNESAYFIIENLNGKHDLKDVKSELDQLHGVSSVSVNTEHHLVAVDYDSSGTSYDKIENRLNKLGYQIAADASDIHTR